MSYIEVDCGYVSPEQVDSRIEDLTAASREFPDEVTVEDLAELAELLAFRLEVTGKVADWAKATIVETDAAAEHFLEDAYDLYGGVVADLGPFVDWERYAAARKVDWGVVVVDGDIFYVK